MKPTINEIEKAKEIVNELIKRYNFFEAIICEDNVCFYSWYEVCKEFLESKGIMLCCGESKACIIPNELPNWVIKVGFVDYSEYFDKMTTDYCRIEAGNFKDAEEEGLGEYFAACYELCSVEPTSDYDYKGLVTFYIQERAESNSSKTSRTCEEYTGSNDNDDEDRVRSLFGESEEVERLIDFLDEWNINDLHSGNFGYTEDGKVKIIDYSGY